MINILDKWNGEFEINGEVYSDIHNSSIENINDGEEFSIRLIPHEFRDEEAEE